MNSPGTFHTSGSLTLKLYYTVRSYIYPGYRGHMKPNHPIELEYAMTSIRQWFFVKTLAAGYVFQADRRCSCLIAHKPEKLSAPFNLH
jgi:hypothetical protein